MRLDAAIQEDAMRIQSIVLATLCIFAVACDTRFEPWQAGPERFHHPGLTDAANLKMTILLNKIDAALKSDFDRRYANWRETWDDTAYLPCSNPRCWTRSPEYAELLNFCQAKGKKIWPLAFKSHLEEKERDYLSHLLIEDLTLPEFRHLLDETHSELAVNGMKNYRDFWMIYIMKVLQALVR
jgi:hypothetical protein